MPPITTIPRRSQQKNSLTHRSDPGIVPYGTVLMSNRACRAAPMASRQPAGRQGVAEGTREREPAGSAAARRNNEALANREDVRFARFAFSEILQETEDNHDQGFATHSSERVRPTNAHPERCVAGPSDEGGQRTALRAG